MTAKEYLQRAWQIDRRIQDKMNQAERLKEMATKVTTTLSGMPGSASHDNHKMDGAIATMMDMAKEIETETERLLRVKTETMQTIWAVEDTTCRTLLELRYISFLPWETIADDMDVSKRRVLQLHTKALKMVEQQMAFHQISPPLHQISP